MKKYFVLAAAVAIHLCLGGIYAWSVFVPALHRDFGYSAAQTQFVFGLTVALLCVASIFGGRMQDLLGPRIPACLSALLLGAGYLCAGFFGNRLWGLVLGVSVLCGSAAGFGYVTSIASAAKWFPARRGLVTGLVVSGYGSAAIFFSTAAGLLLAHGWPVLKIFRAAGCFYGIAVLLAALVLAVPPGGSGGAASINGFRRAALLRDRRFWRIAIGVSCATYPGLALIGALKPVGLWHGFDLVTATAAISALAVGNGAGRIGWGLLHDRLGRGQTVPLLMAAIVASVLVFAAAGCCKWVFLGAAFVLGCCYGGSLAVFPAEVAATYGLHLMGSVYPFALLLHGAAALVAAPLTGLGADLTGGYWPGMALALLAALAGLAACARLARGTDAER